MKAASLLWVDMRLGNAPPETFACVSRAFPAERWSRNAQLAARIREAEPPTLCFEYDFPDADGLDLLQRVKWKNPAIPIVMLTEGHSESLAVWALQIRVWDYMVKPIPLVELTQRFEFLLRGAPAGPGTPLRLPPPALPPLPWAHLPLGGGREPKPSLRPAISCVECFFAQKIPLRHVAQLCGLGPFQFSREFKRAQGVTFREYLVQHRIQQAVKLFGEHRPSVTDVAFTVGFNDLSYFARMFRRYVGVSPSRFRQDGPGAGDNASPDDRAPSAGPAKLS